MSLFESTVLDKLHDKLSMAELRKQIITVKYVVLAIGSRTSKLSKHLNYDSIFGIR